jgi:hypothetical protein
MLRSVLGRKGRLSTSRGFIRRNVWVGPVVALILLVFAGTWVRARMEQAIRNQTESELQTLLQADVTALRLWLASQTATATTAAEESQVRQTVLKLVRDAQEGKSSAAELLGCPATTDLKAALKPWLEAHHYAGFVVIDRETRILASKNDTLVGQKSLPGYTDFVETVLAGRALVSKPFPSIAPVSDEWGNVTTGVPTMFAAAPVRDDSGAAVAVLGLRIRPDQEFTSILNVARSGATGETYAFDQKGMMLTRSRFDDQLKQIGLLPDKPTARSELTIEIRDPQIDLTKGVGSPLRRSEQPLTDMAKLAVAGDDGVNVQGYRDYRGVPTVGAWTWLGDYGFGVVTEMDKAEAFGLLNILRTIFWSLFSLLSVAALALLALTLLARRLERRMRDAVIAAGKLGQYALEEKIGEGGMGSVYRGRHAMLRRPTAIKLLEPSKTTDVAIERFEREVQMTSQLNHPNTITIYDYGRTEEGVFYYAMEYLDGLSLQLLVDCFGPQPDGRVIQIMQQVCGSLVEAHSHNLIHRDIKPANIMLTRRGGVCDFVKLLDFGLVKAIDSQKQRVLTAADSITGTPLYMSPESIEDPNRADCRSDLYSLGAVAYFLLTGRAVFEAVSVLDIIRHHLGSQPASLAERTNQPVSPQLEQLIMSCLAKSPADRPWNAAELAAGLGQCVPAVPWTPKDAQRWWDAYSAVGADGGNGEATRQIDLSATLEHRG